MSSDRLALLDLDGTLIDSARGIIAGMQRAFVAVGADVPTDEVLRSWIGPPVLSTLERELGAQGREVVSQANAAFREYFDATGAHETAVFPGIPEAMCDLAREGFALVVVTHKPRSLAELALTSHDLQSSVAAIHAPSGPGDAVPKEQLFAAALAGFGSGMAIAAGDRATDVAAAAVHGVPSIGVMWGYGSEAELTEAGAVALASVAEDLPALLAEHAMQRP